MRGVFEHLLFPDEGDQAMKAEAQAGGTDVVSNTPNVKGVCAELFRDRFKLVMYEHGSGGSHGSQTAAACRESRGV
jgi:hypothetical protein